MTVFLVTTTTTKKKKTLYERLLRVLVKPHSETSIWKTILTFIGTLLDLDYNIQ